MAEQQSAPKKPEGLKPTEMPSPVQESMKADLSYLDKIPKNPKKPEAQKASLYWYGTLPAVGGVPTYETDRQNNLVRGKDISALEAWTHPERKSEWHGKCPWFQSISIRGITFPAFTGYSQRSGFESPSQAMVFNITKAGAVGQFTEEEVEKILFECAHTVISPATNPRAPHTAEIYRLVEDPPGSGDWKHPSQATTEVFSGQKKVFDVERHRPVADYVYFIKIQNEFQQQDIVSIMKNPLPSLSGR